jgi:outer membrane protein assembly factor BamB
MRQRIMIIASLLTLLLASGCLQTSTPYWTTPGPPHSISISSGFLSKQWERTIFTLSGALERNQCVTSDGSVLVVGSLDVNDPEHLMSFNGSDGTLLWSSQAAGELAITNGQVYVGDQNTIFSLAVSDGSVIWTSNLTGARNIVGLMYYDNLVFVSATGSFPFFTLTPDDGKIKDKFYTTADFRNRFPGVPFYPDFPYSTILSNGIILEQRGDITYSVNAYDNPSHELVWHTDAEVISNIAVMGNTVFMLTADSSLNLVDIRNGNTLLTLPIEPKIDFYNLENNIQHAGYYLCADDINKYLYVILGDSRQMISFRVNQ